MLLQSDFPPDIRLEKEIKSLSKAGYSIRVVCNQYEKKLNPEYEYCTIDRVKALFKSKLLNKIFNFPIFFNPRFVIKILLNVLRFKPGFIHAHDLPMTPLGLLFGKIFGIPVISDMHENYPAALKAFQKKGIVNFIFKNYRAAKILEKYCIKRVDRIITVIDENSQRLINMGVGPQKIYPVSNTVDTQTFAVKSIDQNIAKNYEGKIILLYTGFISPERGLEVVVKGMKYLRGKLPEVKLLLVGDGIFLPSLKQIAKKEQVAEFIEFINWPGHENLGSYLDIAKIGICPQPNNDHWNNSIPHKLFEYMSRSIPVLATDAIPLKRIILETKAGLIYKTDNPESFAEKVIEMMGSEIDFGNSGINAVKEKYSWENDARMLVRLYDEL